MKNFDTLVRLLDREVPWDEEDQFDTQARSVAAILAEAARTPSIISSRTQEICASPRLFAKLAPHMEYPRPPMDKFVLYMDPNDRFRIRLHRFRAARSQGIETIHDHKWHFHSILLRGRYDEIKYRATSVREREMTAGVEEVQRTAYSAGEINSLRSGIPHRVIADGHGEDTFTLFVRSRSFKPFFTRYSDGQGPMRRVYGLHDQLKLGLERAGAFAPDPSQDSEHGEGTR